MSAVPREGVVEELLREESEGKRKKDGSGNRLSVRAGPAGGVGTM